MLLLDTYAFLWFMSDPSRLSEKVNTELENADVVYDNIIREEVPGDGKIN